MPESRFLVGIDLGTVNTALASVDLARSGDLAEAVEAFPLPQLVAPGETASRRLLPSFAYLPGPELPPEARRVPWGESDVVVGELAREQGARVPGRLVSSAKSWLAHPRADRTAPILPWGAPDGVPRLSPVAAQARYLAHLREAWDADPAHAGATFAEQEITLAVPASFDEVARELTLLAAREAALERVRLLEEPAAAFHDWASRHRDDLVRALVGRRGERPASLLVLVVDVGGGTTDLTLVRADVAPRGRPSFTRLAVGQHLLLGGDNMDLALARAVEVKVGEKLDAARFGALVQACRRAKEQLLATGAPERVPVAVAGRGSRLVGSTLSSELRREEVRSLVLDGFFPVVAPRDRPRRAPRGAGLAELGLPYEADPAVSRHLVAFLAAHAEEAGAPPGGLARPDAILVNGGVFTPRELRERLRDVVAGLFPAEAPPRLLASPALDLAVARGAVFAALVRRGIGLRIGGGTARAYYVGIESPEGARALCVVRRHQEEGTRIELARPFALALGRPVRFPLFTSVLPRTEQPGEVVGLSDDLTPLPPVETVLRDEAAATPQTARTPPRGTEVPVRLAALLTEIGTLELWCDATDRDARWKLEFSLRGDAMAPAAPERSEVAKLPPQVEPARAQVDLFYGKRTADLEADVKKLTRGLEKLLGPRDGWPTPVVRELWGALHAGRGRRRRSADHERVWLQLTGFCLRPGFGAPLDAWRAAETWLAFGEGLQHQNDPRAWQAWWVMWRRVAGGLDAAAQGRLFEAISPFVRPPEPRRQPPKRVGNVRGEAVDEMIRLAGALERIDPAVKVELGGWLLGRLRAGEKGPHLLWAVGRLGARVPFYGSAHQVVPADAAEEWIADLLTGSVPHGDLAFPLLQLARCSGDRARDVSEEIRDRVARVLARAGVPEATTRTVRQVAQASTEDERRLIFGESLPAGLRLVGEAEGPAKSA